MTDDLITQVRAALAAATPGDSRLPQRFWAKVVVTAAGCWIWQGGKSGNGYGRFALQSRRMATAHRHTYETFVGPIPPGFQIDHICKVTLCCNPAHLEAVTPKENTRRSNAGYTTLARCPKGHEYTPENTRHTRSTDGRPKRHCRICQRERERRRQQTRPPRRAALAAGKEGPP
jgi:hypothetical protein